MCDLTDRYDCVTEVTRFALEATVFLRMIVKIEKLPANVLLLGVLACQRPCNLRVDCPAATGLACLGCPQICVGIINSCRFKSSALISYWAARKPSGIGTT